MPADETPPRPSVSADPAPLVPAVLAHELRTPLTAIIGFAEALSLGALGPLPDIYREYGAIIHRAALHLLAVVEAQTAPSSPEHFDPTAMAHEVVALFKPRAEAIDVTLRVEPSGQNQTVRANARALRQCLINLIDNGLKFTSPGGGVWIGVRQEERETCISVVNSGGREATGTGQGLSIVRDLCAALGGEVTLEPRGGGGMIASLRIPRCVEG